MDPGKRSVAKLTLLDKIWPHHLSPVLSMPDLVATSC